MALHSPRACIESRKRGVAVRTQAILVLMIVFGLLGSGAVAQTSGELRYVPLTSDPQARAALFLRYNGRNGVIIQSMFGDGFADDALVRQYVGTPRFEVTGCGRKPTDRAVDVRLEKPDFDRTMILDQVLRRAVLHVWQRCPMMYDGAFGARTHDLDLGRLRVFLPDGELVFEATNLLGDNKGQHPAGDGREYNFVYRWESWTNYPAAARERRAQAAAAVERQESETRAVSGFWGWVRMLALAGVALLVWVNREKLLYWFYSLMPHPAAAMVDRAVLTGEELDGEAFAASVRAAEGENDVEKTVRADQARALAERWRKSEAAHKAEESRVLDEVRRETEKNNALFKAQKELLDAAIAHEKAAARVDALHKKKGKP